MREALLLLAIAGIGALGGAIFAPVLGHLVYAYVGGG